MSRPCNVDITYICVHNIMHIQQYKYNDMYNNDRTQEMLTLYIFDIRKGARGLIIKWMAFLEWIGWRKKSAGPRQWNVEVRDLNPVYFEPKSK